MRTSIQSWGNSQAVRLPKTILELAQMNVNDKVDVYVEDNKIVIIKDTQTEIEADNDSQNIESHDGIPQGWKVVNHDIVFHPYNKSISGTLIQDFRKGVYCILDDGDMNPCPQNWAAGIAVLGSRIRYCRIVRHITQQELAKLLDSSLITIKRWEGNKLIPSRAAIVALSFIFQVDKDWLWNGDCDT